MQPESSPHLLQLEKVRVPQLLSLSSRPRGLQLLKFTGLEPMLGNKEKPPQQEAYTPYLESSRCLLQLQKFCMQQ